MLALREQYALKPEDVERVRVRTFTVSSRGNNPSPETIPAAKYSIPYIMGVALRFGAVWREQFTEELLRDEALRAFAKCVTVEADEELDKLYDEKWPSIVEVTCKDGRILTARRDIPKGEPEYPCSEEELRGKFLSLACDMVSPARAEQIFHTVMRLETLADIRELTALLE